MKMKMLLDKTENDDKLISMLKQEIARLENVKGVKSNLKSDNAANHEHISEMKKLKRDTVNLGNQVKCLEIELEQKEAKIKQLMVNCVGAPDEAAEEKELRIAELEEKVDNLERALFKAKEDAKSGDKYKPKRSKDEQEKIISELTKSNAMLRRKLDDA